MAHLRASFVYAVKGLWVDDRVLGSVIKCEREGHPIELRMPTRPDQYREQTGLDTPAITEGVHWEEGDTDTGVSGHFSVVNQIEVNVLGDLDLLSADYEDFGPAGDSANKCHGFWAETMPVAAEVISEFIEWARVEGQPDLGLRGETPQYSGRQVIYDEGLNAPLPLEWPWWSRGGWEMPTAVTPDRFSAIGSRVAQGVEPDLVHSSIADAQALVVGPNDMRAVLTAAIAVEVRAKEVLRQAAVAPADKVIAVLLDNPRDWSMAAATLLDKPMEAVTGRSLRKENKSLWKKAELLFQTRNGIAHRGEDTSDIMPNNLVEAAAEIVAWLDSIVIPRTE